MTAKTSRLEREDAKKKAIKVLKELFSMAKMTDLGSELTIVDSFFQKYGFKDCDDFVAKTDNFGFRDPNYRDIEAKAFGVLLLNWKRKFQP